MKPVSPADTRVGFIGLGVMGKSMARNILKAGYKLAAYDLFPAAAAELAKDGAIVAIGPAAAADADVVMLSLPDTPDVERVLFDDGGIASVARAGTIVVDFSSISGTATAGFAERLATRGIAFVDSPVSGGPKGAADGTLSCMIGGADEAVAAVMPLLQVIGAKHAHLGAAGAGQLVKSCNQMVIASTLVAVAEAIALCRANGIDAAKMRDVLLGGAAQSAVLQVHGKRILDGTVAPGFRSALMLKDLKLAVGAGRDAGVFMPTTALTAQIYTMLCNGAERDLDHAALGLLIQRLSGLEATRTD